VDRLALRCERETIHRAIDVEETMKVQEIHDLSKCSEFYQTLQARPPAVVHGTAFLLISLLGVALAWAWLTSASLVVRAPGRVRPVTEPTRVFNAGSGETLSASSGGRVVAVHFHEGDVVKKGDVLLRLDTERLDQDLDKKKQAITAGEEEVRQLAKSYELLSREHAAARSRAEAELAQAVDEIGQEKKKRATELAEAKADWEQADYEEKQTRKLWQKGAAAEADLVKAVARLKATEERLAKARLPVPEGRLLVLRRAGELLDKEYAVKKEDTLLKQSTRQAAVKADRIELAKLELERKQSILRAPCDGVVISPNIKVGDVLERGKAVVEIAAQGGFYFDAEVSTEEVGLLKVGMPVRLRLDAFDYQKYGTVDGTVVFLSPDARVKELPNGGQRAAYLVKVRVEGEEIGRGEYRGQIKLGMAGQADIVIGQESLLALLLKKIRQTISLG
jgi:multidrug efflux pump subunit AcrA (membrane-fusion protein)